MSIRRLLIPPKQSFFLLGPRGTGKSTWLRQVLPGAHWVDLLDESLYQRLLVAPQQFAAEIRRLPPDQWVVVDEVQRLPNLLNEVHRAIEGTGRKFALCASSARKLRRSGVNLLAGRAVPLSMHSFLPEELGADFDMEAALRDGLLPLVWGAPDRAVALRAYAELYLKEEIQAEAQVRNLAAFARFLPIAALLNGKVLNTSNVGREAGVSRSTVEGYLSILEDTLLCFRLPAFEAKLRVRERRSPKWYWCDPGLARAMKQSSGPPAPEERGALFEGLVAQILRAHRDYRGAFDRMSYWASASSRQTEVDFVLERSGRRVAVEVKSGLQVREDWGRGLRAVEDLPGLVRRILVYPSGPSLQWESGIEVLPLVEFSRLLGSGDIFDE